MNNTLNITENNNIILHSEPTIGSQVNELIELFEPINPSYRKFFSHKTQRKALANIITKYGFDQTQRMLEKLPEVLAKPYAPVITTPIQLENKLGELILFVKKQGNSKGGVLDATNL